MTTRIYPDNYRATYPRPAARRPLPDAIAARWGAPVLAFVVGVAVTIVATLPAQALVSTPGAPAAVSVTVPTP